MSQPAVVRWFVLVAPLLVSQAKDGLFRFGSAKVRMFFLLAILKEEYFLSFFSSLIPAFQSVKRACRSFLLPFVGAAKVRHSFSFGQNFFLLFYQEPFALEASTLRSVWGCKGKKLF